MTTELVLRGMKNTTQIELKGKNKEEILRIAKEVQLDHLQIYKVLPTLPSIERFQE